MDTDTALRARPAALGLSSAVDAAVDPTTGAARTASPGTWRDYLALTKPRITALVLVTAAAGFYAASGAFDVALFLHAMIGTGLVAAGTSAMNQVLERDVDALMARTRNRPVPAGRIGATPAAVFSGTLAAAGILYLALAVNALTAGLAAASFVIYDFLYTPLKRVHSFSTVIGAVPGALPILGGWTAASGQLAPGGIALFGILFLWQLPHFLALAWLLRDDYGAAGLRMLSVGDRAGVQTRHQALLYTLALLPASLLPAVVGLAGAAYFWAALALGIGFVAVALAFWRVLSARSAARLFRYSIVYLPLLLVALTLGKV